MRWKLRRIEPLRTANVVAVTYNLVVGWTGGLRFEFRDGSPEATGPAPSPAGL